jgi:phosphatidylglycerophosphatase C
MPTTSLRAVDVTVAVFDVDKTLTVRDCVVPFVTRVAGPSKVLLAIARNGGTVARLLATRDRDGLKLLFVRELFAGRSVEEIEGEGVQFAALVADGWMREDVAARLRWHQTQGHVVVLVSASLSPYLVPLGDLLEVDAVLCATLEEQDGVYTGNLVGANCRGIEKVNRLAEWSRDSGVSMESIRYAYGDSSGDEAMLNLAPHAEWIGKRDLSEVPA